MKRIQLDRRTDLRSEIPLGTPYCIFIDPSSACNFKCGFCMNQELRHTSVMRFDLFRKIIDDLQEFDSPVKTVRLYGFGEPLVNRDFCSMVRYAKSSDKVLSVDTTTNAGLLSDGLIDEICGCGIDRINVSIYATSTDKYVEFTRSGGASFERIVDNISKLFSRRGKMVIFVKICGDFLSEQEKSDFVRVFSPISDGCDIEHTMSCWKDFKVEGVNQQVGVYGQPLKEVLVCPYVFYSFMIHADGYVSACFLDWNKKLIIGDVKNESVKSLWGDKLFNQHRVMMLRKERKGHSCCGGCQQLVAGMPVDLDDCADVLLRKFQ